MIKESLLINEMTNLLLLQWQWDVNFRILVDEWTVPTEAIFESCRAGWKRQVNRWLRRSRWWRYQFERQPHLTPHFSPFSTWSSGGWQYLLKPYRLIRPHSTLLPSFNFPFIFLALTEHNFKLKPTSYASFLQLEDHSQPLELVAAGSTFVSTPPLQSLELKFVHTFHCGLNSFTLPLWFPGSWRSAIAAFLIRSHYHSLKRCSERRYDLQLSSYVLCEASHPLIRFTNSSVAGVIGYSTRYQVDF